MGRKEIEHRLYKSLFSFGGYICHQLQERSFFYFGKQFPVCARCQGLIIGCIFGVCLAKLWLPDYRIPLIGLQIMFLDWLLNVAEILKGTNIRRLISGIVGGYSITCNLFLIIKHWLL